MGEGARWGRAITSFLKAVKILIKGVLAREPTETIFIFYIHV
jgi:hypothetical protein